MGSRHQDDSYVVCVVYDCICKSLVPDVLQSTPSLSYLINATKKTEKEKSSTKMRSSTAKGLTIQGHRRAHQDWGRHVHADGGKRSSILGQRRKHFQRRHLRGLGLRFHWPSSPMFSWQYITCRRGRPTTLRRTQHNARYELRAHTK